MLLWHSYKKMTAQVVESDPVGLCDTYYAVINFIYGGPLKKQSLGCAPDSSPRWQVLDGPRCHGQRWLACVILRNPLRFSRRHLLRSRHGGGRKGRGESLCPQTKSQNNPSVSGTHLFWIPPFYPFASIPSATRAALMTYSTEKKRQLPSNCVCVDLWVPLKENYGWQQEERRGERMWEGQWWFGTKAAGERWPSLAGWGRTSR